MHATVSIDYNEGRFYETIVQGDTRYTIDFSEIKLGNVDMVSTDQDATFSISDNELAHIEVGDVTMAGDDVDFVIEDNDVENSDADFNSDTTEVDISVGAVEITANDEATFGIDDNHIDAPDGAISISVESV